jgi:uncharacterized protein YutE (UPF0331/DUF86 family)
VPADPEIIRSRLLDITEAVSRLRSWLPLTAVRLERDVMLRWAVEHGLHIAAEALFDAGSHLLSGEFQETADEYREIAPRLLARGVLSSDTAQRLESLAGFRNVLVHDYAGSRPAGGPRGLRGRRRGLAGAQAALTRAAVAAVLDGRLQGRPAPRGAGRPRAEDEAAVERYLVSSAPESS